MRNYDEKTIDEKLYQDDYKWNKEKHIKFKTNGLAAQNLHDLLYYCPKCGSEFTMVGEKDTLKCTKCGNGCTIDDYYDMHPYMVCV